MRVVLADVKGADGFVTPDECVDGDVAVVLSSLVDDRHETAWCMSSFGIPHQSRCGIRLILSQSSDKLGGLR